MIYWFTGQPGAGKTTLANKLYSHLSLNKNLIINIDGDELRDIFNNKVYTTEGRIKNIERAYDIGYFLHKKGYDVIISLVSPFREQREIFKQKDKFVEIYIHTENIRGRELYHVIDYQPPLNNFIDIDTTSIDEELSFKQLIDKLKI
jgi:adenylylsulfate kinase-like enzyme